MAVTQKFTNSSLISKTILSPNCNPREFNISGIVIHTMAGNMYVDNCGYMFQSSKAASSNYGIGSDGRIDLFVEEKNRAWTSGGYEADGKTENNLDGLIVGAESAIKAANETIKADGKGYCYSLV